MEMTEALGKLLRSFERYYDVRREQVTEPFAAEAEFSLHDEQYFLVKSARLAEADSKEYVYFATADRLDGIGFAALDRAAWEKGLARVKPHANHRNTDIVLVILADHIEESVFSAIPKTRHYKSYRLGFQGWSHYRLIAVELSSGRTAANRQGQSLRKLVSNIF
ncbi:MAG: hypothetical protein HFI66_06760 [Lachnospiraceae bacterium]|jgi:hypothetical protein|nr:hypothetical protein [Lachnospiraceae bacterium]